MIDNIKHITVNNVEYPMAFTLNVLENIQEKYGSLEEWGDILEPDEGEPSIKDVKWVFTEFINEGIDMENELKDEKRPFLTTKQVGRIVSGVGIKNITAIIKGITSDSNPQSSGIEETETKNE